MRIASAAQAPAAEPDTDEDGFDEALLAALVAMAVRSKRRQADVTAAMARGKLTEKSEHVMAALRKLEAQGRVRDLVPLYDGGMLVTVTNTGMDLGGASRQWHFLQAVNGAAAA
ncbi:MAG: hypothetical protein JOY70_10825 [Acidisphaera sp.]|nr:hypothetical protein [Acidisphaera sp.]